MAQLFQSARKALRGRLKNVERITVLAKVKRRVTWPGDWILEAMNRDWSTDYARRIYRKLGDREKYLELWSKKLVCDGDYHDLATYYWN